MNNEIIIVHVSGGLCTKIQEGKEEIDGYIVDWDNLKESSKEEIESVLEDVGEYLDEIDLKDLKDLIRKHE